MSCEQRQEIIDRMIQIAKTASENSGGKLRLAYNEEDMTTDKAEAGHFFKFNEKRLGRDIELYGFMCELTGNAFALAEFAQAIGMIKAVGLNESWESVRHDCANLSEFIPDELVSQYRDLYSIPSPKTSTSN